MFNLSFKQDITKPNKDNLIDQYLREDTTLVEMKEWSGILNEIPTRLTKEEKVAWLSNLSGVSLGSDGFFPFRDNIDRVFQSGVKYIVQLAGSVRDDIVIKACNEYNISIGVERDASPFESTNSGT